MVPAPMFSAPHSPSLRQCRLPHIYAFNQLSIPSKSSFSISIYTPTPINRLQDYCSPIDKFKIISKFVKFISDSSSHSPKQVRLPQTPDIPFGSSPRPRRHTASQASRTRASAPAGSATPRNFPERPHRIPRPMLPESASRPPGDKNKTAAQRDVPSAPSASPHTT